MVDVIQLSEIIIRIQRKTIKNVHLTVHPPDGQVTLHVPLSTRLEVARAYAITKLPWIRARQMELRNQARESPRQFIERESHYVWGKRYLLTIQEVNAKPSVEIDHRRILLKVRPQTSHEKRAEIMHEWHKKLLHGQIPQFIQKWELKLKVKVRGYFLRRMKTKWGSCNHQAGNIRLNTELVKKPLDLLEYVIVHEMVHLIVPVHSRRFMELLDQHYSGWREAREELNALPLS